MKSLTIIFIAFLSFNAFSLEQCTPEAQYEIDSLLGQMKNTKNSIAKIDLEFEVRRISYGYSNCRKSIIERNIASVDEVEVIDQEQFVSDQLGSHDEIDEVLSFR